MNAVCSSKKTLKKQQQYDPWNENKLVMPTFWTGSCRTVRLLSRNPSVQHSMGCRSSGLPALHQAACRADPKALHWLPPSCRWFFVVFLPSSWTGVCSSGSRSCGVLQQWDKGVYDCKQVETCITGFFKGRYWDREIYDCRQAETCITGFFKGR